MPIMAVPGVRSDADGYTSGLVLHNGSGGGRSVGCALPPDGRVLFQRGARSGPSCGVWAGVRLDEPTTGERLRNLQESDVSLQQRLQVSRAAHGLNQSHDGICISGMMRAGQRCQVKLSCPYIEVSPPPSPGILQMRISPWLWFGITMTDWRIRWLTVLVQLRISDRGKIAAALC